MDELKLCPFCRALGEIVKVDKNCYYPRCIRHEGCGCEMNGGTTEEEAAAVWNTRPIEDAQAEQIKKLIKYKEVLINWHNPPAPDDPELIKANLQAEWDALEDGYAKLIEQLKEFARRIIRSECWGYVDGGDVQEIGEQLGLIKPHIATEADVDPEHDDFEVGDIIYKFTDILEAAQPQKGASDE